jgi:hypothetical protein
MATVFTFENRGTGATGPSAYQVAVANGFVGTESQWLESLKGAPGVQGVPGPAGPPGELLPIAANSLLGNDTNSTALPTAIPFGNVPALIGVPTNAQLTTALSTKVDTTDSRLSDSREWTASTIDQAEAEAGTATTRRAWTAQRVRQAITSWWSTVTDAVKSFNTTITGGLNFFAVTKPVNSGDSARFEFASHSNEYGTASIYAEPDDGIILTATMKDAPDDWQLTIHRTGYSVSQPAAFRAAINALGNTFETVSQSLASLPYAITYSSGRISTIVYTLPNNSTITKTINYTGDKVTSIVLSGATPFGIQLTKTITYTGDNITGVSYS